MDHCCSFIEKFQSTPAGPKVKNEQIFTYACILSSVLMLISMVLVFGISSGLSLRLLESAGAELVEAAPAAAAANPLEW